MITTPFAKANPAYAALLNGVTGYRADPVNREVIEIFLFASGRFLWRSGEKPIGFRFDSPLNISFRPKDRPIFYLYYTRFVNGFPYRIKLRFSIRKFLLAKAQRAIFSINDPDVPYQPAIAKARRWVASRLKERRIRYRVSRSSPSRPSPEVRNTSWLEVSERDFKDFNPRYALAVTPRTRDLYSRSWTGTRTPGYGKIRKSLLPVNPHTAYIRVNDVDTLSEYDFTTHGSGKGDWKWNILKVTTRYPNPPELTAGLPLARNKAIRELISRAGVGLEANLAQDFAQIGKTLNLVGDTATRIKDSLLALKRLNLSKASQALFAGKRPRYHPGKQPSMSKSLAENWLALQYGWKPLLMDIHGSFQALAKMNLGEAFVQTVTSRGTAMHTTETKIPLWNDANVTAGVMRIHQHVTSKFVLRYRIRSHLKAFLAQTGFTNPVNLAWEILPFSFVVDWFLPIGPYLETLSSWDGLEFVDGSETDFNRQLATIAINLSVTLPETGANNMKVHMGQYRRETIGLTRLKLTTFPAQTLPTFRNGLANHENLRAINALALMKQVFG